MKSHLKLNIFLLAFVLGGYTTYHPALAQTSIANSQPFGNQIQPPKDCPFSDWAKEATLSVMTFNAENFESRKSANKKYFTNSGFKSFYEALDLSRIPQMVRDTNLDVTSAVMSDPKVTQVDQTQDSIRYVMEMKLATTYTNRSSTRTDMLPVTLTVVERATSPGHWHIEQWMTK